MPIGSRTFQQWHPLRRIIRKARKKHSGTEERPLLCLRNQAWGSAATLLAVLLSALSPLSGGIQAQAQSPSQLAIDAEAVEWFREKNMAVWEQAVVTFRDVTLSAIEMDVFYQGDATGGDVQISKLVARGDVVFTSDQGQVDAQRADLDMPTLELILTGGVTLKQDGNVLCGARLVADLNKDGTGRLEGGCPQTGESEGGRVQGLFVVPQQ